MIMLQKCYDVNKSQTTNILRTFPLYLYHLSYVILVIYGSTILKENDKLNVRYFTYYDEYMSSLHATVEHLINNLINKNTYSYKDIHRQTELTQLYKHIFTEKTNAVEANVKT